MTSFSVENASEFMTALTSAKGGDSIILEEGDYGNVIIRGKKAASGIIIQSASTSRAAHFDTLMISKSSHLNFKNIDIGGTDNVKNSTVKSFISSSDDITFDGLSIHGSLDKNPQNDYSGIRILESKNIVIKNSEFQQLLRGAYFQNSNGINFSNNNIHDIRMDGVVFAQVKNVVIDGNLFTNFHRSLADHSDAIQFWTTNTASASTDIKIRNNQILQGSGTAMQGIFMSDEVGRFPYARVTIENNLIYESGYANGITVGHGRDITINKNTAISSSVIGGATKIRISNVSGLKLTNNVTDLFNFINKNSRISSSGNVQLVKSPAVYKTIKDIAAGATAKAAGLVLAGVGYQLKTAGPAGGPIGSPTPAPAPGPAPQNMPLSTFVAPTLADVLLKEAPMSIVATTLKSSVLPTAASTSLLSTQAKASFPQLHATN